RVGPPLGRVRPVGARPGAGIAPDLAADRGRRPSQLAPDLPRSRVLAQPVGDVDPLVLGQGPRRARRRASQRPGTLPPRVAGRGKAAVPPFPARPQVDPDELARFLAAQALVHEPEVFLPLTDQLPPPLRLTVRANLELHDTPDDLGCCDDR